MPSSHSSDRVEEVADEMAGSQLAEPIPGKSTPTHPQDHNHLEKGTPPIVSLPSRSGSLPDSQTHSSASPTLAPLTIKTSNFVIKDAHAIAPKSDPEYGPSLASPPIPPPKDDTYKSKQSSGISRTTDSDELASKEAAEFDTGHQSDGNALPSSTEITSIMRQFEGANVPGEDEIMSPRMELAASVTANLIRRSSLDHKSTKVEPTISEEDNNKANPVPSPPKRTSSLPSIDQANDKDTLQLEDEPKSNPLPQPSPSSTVPFNFNRFLEQLRHRTADPVAKYLRSFLQEFAKKQWMVHEQVKIISDFLDFISKKMEQCEVWRRVSDAEFDNSREGMEKLVMNRLHDRTFSPKIPVLESNSARKRFGPLPRFFRRGQHQEDVERDEVLAQKVLIYGWVRETHLDIAPMDSVADKFLFKQAQEEINKINNYRAPRDKVVCILNCCKVIFGLLRKSKSDQSADSFIPLLIYVILQANPNHLVSNVQYILRFRNQDKLAGEAGYYISTLMGAIQFIESLDRTHLTISDEEFERNVEEAVSAIAERHRQAEKQNDLKDQEEKKTENETTSRQLSLASALPDEIPAVAAGILRTIQRPLTTIGKIFSDDTPPERPISRGPPTPSKSADATPHLSEKSGLTPLRARSDTARSRSSGPGDTLSTSTSLTTTPVKSTFHIPRAGGLTPEQKARQLSAEEAEARVIQAQEHSVVVDTLVSMFPDLDREVIEDVVREKHGQVSAAVDACLALSNG